MAKAENLKDIMNKMCNLDVKLHSVKLNRMLDRMKLNFCMDTHNKTNTIGVFCQIKRT